MTCVCVCACRVLDVYVLLCFRRCLELVELVTMFAPADVPGALPEIMPFVQVSSLLNYSAHACL